MSLNWILFFPALLLLFYPLELLLPKHFGLKELPYIDFGEAGARRRAPWSIPALWSDGIRSFAGGFMLRSAWHLEAGVRGLYQAPVVASLLILSLSILVQMHTRRKDDRFIAPVAFVIGLWLALLPASVALVAVAAGGVCMVAMRSLTAFFFCGAVAVGIFGYGALHAGYWALAAAVLGVMPCLISLLARRRLAVPVRVEVVTARARDIGMGDLLRINEADNSRSDGLRF